MKQQALCSEVCRPKYRALAHSRNDRTGILPSAALPHQTEHGCETRKEQAVSQKLGAISLAVQGTGRLAMRVLPYQTWENAEFPPNRATIPRVPPCRPSRP